MTDRRPVRVEMAGTIRPDRWLEYIIFPTADGLRVAFRDRTMVHRDTETLQASEERLRDLLATLDLGNSMARDLDGIISLWSVGCALLVAGRRRRCSADPRINCSARNSRWRWMR